MQVIQRLDAVQYDGTNGTYIATEFLTNTRVGSDDGQTLQLFDDANDPQIPLGGWVVRSTVGVGRYQYIGAYPNEAFQAIYTVLP